MFFKKEGKSTAPLRESMKIYMGMHMFHVNSIAGLFFEIKRYIRLREKIKHYITVKAKISDRRHTVILCVVKHKKGNKILYQRSI